MQNFGRGGERRAGYVGNLVVAEIPAAEREREGFLIVANAIVWRLANLGYILREILCTCLWSSNILTAVPGCPGPGRSSAAV